MCETKQSETGRQKCNESGPYFFFKGKVTIVSICFIAVSNYCTNL